MSAPARTPATTTPTDPGTAPSGAPPAGPPPGAEPTIGAPGTVAGSTNPIGRSTAPTGSRASIPGQIPAGTSGNVDNPADIAAPYELSTANFLQSFRMDRRFTSVPYSRAAPIHHVLVNFSRLYDVFQAILRSSLNGWSALRSTIPGTANDINTEINNGADALASAMILQLYNLLRIKFYSYDNANSARYRNRSPLDRNALLPSGCHFIVEQFGLTKPTDAYGNIRFLHHWDNAEPNDFGLPAGKRLNATHLQMIMTSLKDIGCPTRRMEPFHESRTPWDSLFVTNTEDGYGYNVATTYPENNYTLFKDAFIQIGINGVTSLASDTKPVEFYAPRAAWRNTNAMRDDCKRTLPPGPDATEAAQFNAAAAAADLNFDEVLPMGHLSNIHPTGLHLTRGPAAADGTHPINYRALIYGRGFAGDVFRINSIVRGVTHSEVDTFFNILIRKGY